MSIVKKTITKKAVKKAPAKKTTAKKTTTKKSTKKTSKIEDRYVVSELAFYCCDNNVFYNLSQLCDGLDKMSNDTFNFHVNDVKNDFYNWIRYVYKELELAESIVNIRDTKEMKKLIKSFI